MRVRLKSIDAFAGVNAVLFVVLCVFRYYDRFLQYVGPDRVQEFFIYAAVILAGIGMLWRLFRRYSFEPVVLVLVEIGILMHFAGAFVMVEEGRLYDVLIAGVRYDKFVHAFNACTVTLLLDRVFAIQRIPRTPVNALLLMMVVLGLGAVVEIVEYAVVLTVPANGVGGYDNNMQDLIANAGGAVLYLALRAVRGSLRRYPYVHALLAGSRAGVRAGARAG
jgi:putative membrane protein